MMTRVCAAIICRDDKFLITSRPPGKHMAGCWEFPGGKPEPGENDCECLKREIIEELQIDISILDKIFESAYAYPEKRVFLNFYRCTIENNAEPEPAEGQQIMWLKADKLKDPRLLPPDRPLAEFLSLCKNR